MITETFGVEKDIIVSPELAMVVSAQVGNSGLSADDDGKKILYAGTPLFGDLADRDTAFVKATISGAEEGVYTAQITTPFEAGDTVVIDGVEYTAGATADAETQTFAVGSGANDQVTSLKAIIDSANYDVTGATDTLTFTQKVANESLGAVSIEVDSEATGVFGDVTETTAADNGTSNANAVLRHTVDVTEGDNNGAILLSGTVDLLKLDDDTVELITSPVKEALEDKIFFIEGAK